MKEVKNYSVEELEALIPMYSREYYMGRQIISDEEFDHLVEQLRKQKPDSYILSSVGWGGMDSGFSHRFKSKHLGELVSGIGEKLKYPCELKKKYTTITPKIDGGSVCLYYKDGIPFALITRGNGKEGINILHKFVDRFPKIDEKRLVCIRGEVYTPKSYFQELKEKKIPSPRNYAIGVCCRDSDSSDPDLKYVNFVFYQIRIYPSLIESKENVIKTITESFRGLPCVPSVPADNISPENLLKIYENFQNLDYPLDGLVLTRSIHNREISEGYSIEEEVTAYKFQSESAETEVIDVVWTTGSSGRINPVVEFNPVFLAGATIQKATGFNARFITDNGIGKGALIKITRSNEVIPYIQEVVNPTEAVLPTLCPVCNSVLVNDGVNLCCKNSLCMERIEESCVRILSLIDMPNGLKGRDGISIKKIIGCSCSGKDISIKSMLSFIKNGDFNTLNSVLSPHYFKLSVSHLNNLRSKILGEGILPNEFWYILNLPLIGKKQSEKIPAFEESFDSSILTPSLSRIINKNIEYIKDIYKFIDKEIFPFPKERREEKTSSSQSAIKKIPVCYTGATDKFSTRKEFFSYYKDRVEEVSIKKARYLICNKESSSSKYTYARNNRIPIITEEEFVNLLSDLKD